MKYNKIIMIMMMKLLVGNIAFSAVYNLPSHVSNIPVYSTFDKNDIITGISSGFYTINGNAQYEFDLKAIYALSNRLLIGANMINKSDIVFHMHYHFYSTFQSRLKVTGGITDIPTSKKKAISSFDTFSITQENILSPYISASYLTKIVNYHIGYGGTRFQFADKSTAHLKKANGLFFGIEIPISIAFISFEYDGKDFNIGAAIPMTSRTTFYGGLTEFFRYKKEVSNNVNPQYNNQPLRWFSFGMSHRFNVASPDEEKEVLVETFELKEEDVIRISDELSNVYQDELDKWRQEREGLISEIDRLKSAIKEDIRYIDKEEFEEKETFRQQYLSTNQDISEKVLSYYYESFEYYTQKKYHEAILVLQKAIALNPYLPQLYVRMGSIYFDLELTEMALMQWEKALELDPQNIKLSERVTALRKI
ncbi:hypothetical protein CL658_00575 [bacterium]|nr:hypothetical protein [bacterium]